MESPQDPVNNFIPAPASTLSKKLFSTTTRIIAVVAMAVVVDENDNNCKHFDRAGPRPSGVGWNISHFHPQARHGRFHSPSTGTPTATTRNFHGAKTPATPWLKSGRALTNKYRDQHYDQEDQYRTNDRRSDRTLGRYLSSYKVRITDSSFSSPIPTSGLGIEAPPGTQPDRPSALENLHERLGESTRRVWLWWSG